ncbi:MAG: hypothetical protein KGI49_01030 [Patescibacteria group bacterium]|nr:hypothetical protein [Patescibacteria group bacterium]
MSIQSYIANLKTRPDHVRRKTAFWWSFGITAIIAAFYIGSITGINIQSGAAVASIADKAGSPVDSMVAGAGALADDIWTMITGPKKVTYSEVQVTPGVK